MTSTVEPRRWTRRRWWLWLMLVFAGHLGLILFLSDRTPIRVRPPLSAPQIALVGNNSAQLLALLDPTLFALPHPQDFPSSASVTIPPANTHPPDPPAPLVWLPMPVERLGQTFDQFVATNQLNSPL